MNDPVLKKLEEPYQEHCDGEIGRNRLGFPTIVRLKPQSNVLAVLVVAVVEDSESRRTAADFVLGRLDWGCARGLTSPAAGLQPHRATAESESRVKWLTSASSYPTT
jgi:hypothetical protein